MRSLRLYRLEVQEWPTIDGQPFQDQPETWWGTVLDVEAGNPPPDGWEQPDWLPPDFLHWTWGMHADPFLDAPRAGYPFVDLELVVPRTPTRRHYISRAAAERQADVYRSWGCTVTVTASDPITWPDA